MRAVRRRHSSRPRGPGPCPDLGTSWEAEPRTVAPGWLCRTRPGATAQFACRPARGLGRPPRRTRKPAEHGPISPATRMPRPPRGPLIAATTAARHIGVPRQRPLLHRHGRYGEITNHCYQGVRRGTNVRPQVTSRVAIGRFVMQRSTGSTATQREGVCPLDLAITRRFDMGRSAVLSTRERA